MKQHLSGRASRNHRRVYSSLSLGFSAKETRGSLTAGSEAMEMQFLHGVSDMTTE